MCAMNFSPVAMFLRDVIGGNGFIVLRPHRNGVIEEARAMDDSDDQNLFVIDAIDQSVVPHDSFAD